MTALVGAMSLAGCSLMSWDLDGLHCSETRECLEGYSCIGEICTRDNSLSQDDTCTMARQCESGLTCSARFVCRPVCADDFGSNGCAADQYCLPVADGTSGSGACWPTECTADADCDAAAREICVPLSATASACLPGCSLDWHGGTYFDNCTTLSDEGPKRCQPLGVTPRLVCLPANGAQNALENCALVNPTCASGLACVGGTCHAYCDPSGEPCGGGLSCVEQAGTPAFAICE